MTQDDPLARRLAKAVDRWRRHAKTTRLLDAARGDLRAARSALHAAEVALAAARGRSGRYERAGLRALVARLFGSLDRRRAEERRNLADARAAHAAATARVAATEADVAALAAALRELGTTGDVEAEYAAAFAAQEQALVHGPRGADVIEASRRHAALVADRREVDEAMTAGTNAAARLRSVAETLASARRFGIWDLLGGGILVTMAKRRRMRDAAADAHRTSAALARFQRELADVARIPIDPLGGLDLSGYLRLSDFFFDGIADWFVQSRISEARRNVDGAQDRVDHALAALETRRSRLDVEIAAAADRRRQVVGPHLTA